MMFSESNDETLRRWNRAQRWGFRIAPLLLLVVAGATFDHYVAIFVDYSPSNESTKRPIASDLAPLTDQNEPAKHKHKRSIRQISILGERNSGTRWTSDHLAQCFNHTLIVRPRLTRWKHFFQDGSLGHYKKDALVVALFRNPYDWVEAMRQIPHHASAHIGLKWREFCSKTWTTERFGADLTITDENTKCQESFRFKDIVTCFSEPIPKSEYKNGTRFSNHQPFYEMRNDGSGEPYNNILEMRAAKIRNFVHDVNTYDGVRDVWLTQYEFLLERGTKSLLDRIQAFTGVPYECDPYPAQKRRRRSLSPEYIDYLTANVDWEAEKLVGYVPIET